MSKKFEQLLDYLVNEEMDKANELFHEIVVEKSRNIYETLLAEEADDEEVDEATDEMDDEAVDEGAEEELEDSYMMDADDDDDVGGMGGDMDDDMTGDMDDDMTGDMDGDMDEPVGGDAGDDMLGDIEVGGDDDTAMQAIDEIKDAIADLEAALASENDDMGDFDSDTDVGSDGEFGDGEFDDEDDGEETSDEIMGMGLREYRETVGNDWHKNSQKTQGQIVGANTGEKMPGSNEGKSPISSGKGKPSTGADAKNILAKNKTHDEDGTKPHGKVGGLVKQGGQFVDGKTHNVGNVKSGVKTLSKVGHGHEAEKKGGSEGQAVGAGSGENSVKGTTNTRSIVDRKIG